MPRDTQVLIQEVEGDKGWPVGGVEIPEGRTGSTAAAVVTCLAKEGGRGPMLLTCILIHSQTMRCLFLKALLSANFYKRVWGLHIGYIYFPASVGCRRDTVLMTGLTYKAFFRLSNGIKS